MHITQTPNDPQSSLTTPEVKVKIKKIKPVTPLYPKISNPFTRLFKGLLRKDNHGQ